jgi:excisionase family DNA binding protein
MVRMKQAAEYTGLCKDTLRKYIDLGKIQGIRIGTHRYVSIEELDRFLNSGD